MKRVRCVLGCILPPCFSATSSFCWTDAPTVAIQPLFRPIGLPCLLWVSIHSKGGRNMLVYYSVQKKVVVGQRHHQHQAMAARAAGTAAPGVLGSWEDFHSVRGHHSTGPLNDPVFVLPAAELMNQTWDHLSSTHNVISAPLSTLVDQCPTM